MLSSALISSVLPFVLGVSPDPILAESQLQDWVRTFAPIVVHDSREIAPLTSVDAQLALQPVLKGRCADGQQRSLPVSDPGFLQRPDVQSLVSDCKQELALHFSRKIPAPEPVAYYSVLTEGLYIKLQYWLYYGWNDTTQLGGGPIVQQCGEHEGDWEHVAIRLRRDRLATASTPDELKNAIDDIYLAQHHRVQHPERKFFRINDPRLRFEGTHLQVFSGLGSHATYVAPGRYPIMTIAGVQIGDVNDGKGLRMNLAEGRLEPVVRQPWFGFPGRWGAVVHDACDPLEAVSSASNDGSYGPGHAHKVQDLYEGDWHDLFRPLAGS